MSDQRDPLITEIIGCGIEVHEALGPGLLESAYRSCLAREFGLRGIRVVAELALPIVYKGMRLDCGYRLDFVVDNRVVVEVKAVERLAPIHEAQLITYLKLLKVPRGLLLNFNAPRLTKGVRSISLHQTTEG